MRWLTVWWQECGQHPQLVESERKGNILVEQEKTMADDMGSCCSGHGWWQVLLLWQWRWQLLLLLLVAIVEEE